MAQTKHVFTPADIAAIRTAVREKYGSEADLAREAGINQPSSINQYCKGQTRSCTRATWDKLLRVIAPFYANQPPPAECAIEVTEPQAPGVRVATDIIGLYGIPVERISSAISAAPFLTEEQKKYLIYEIFKG